MVESNYICIFGKTKLWCEEQPRYLNKVGLLQSDLWNFCIRICTTDWVKLTTCSIPKYTHITHVLGSGSIVYFEIDGTMLKGGMDPTIAERSESTECEECYGLYTKMKSFTE